MATFDIILLNSTLLDMESFKESLLKFKLPSLTQHQKNRVEQKKWKQRTPPFLLVGPSLVLQTVT